MAIIMTLACPSKVISKHQQQSQCNILGSVQQQQQQQQQHDGRKKYRQKLEEWRCRRIHRRLASCQEVQFCLILFVFVFVRPHAHFFLFFPGEEWVSECFLFGSLFPSLSSFFVGGVCLDISSFVLQGFHLSCIPSRLVFFISHDHVVKKGRARRECVYTYEREIERDFRIRFAIEANPHFSFVSLFPFSPPAPCLKFTHKEKNQ